MSHRHPIDDLFRKQLENYSVDPPMQVWQRIDESRRRTAVMAAPARLSSLWIAACTAFFLFIPQSEWTPRTDSGLRETTKIAVLFPSAQTVPLPPTSHEAALAPETPQGADDAISGALSNAGVSTGTVRSSMLAEATPPVTPAPETDEGLDAVAEASPAHVRLLDAEPLPPNNSLKLLQRARSFPESSKCATFKNMGLRFHLELSASPDMAFRELEPRVNSAESAAYSNLRDQSEHAQLNYSFAARIAASTRFGLTLRSGVQYSQINEQLRFVTETEQRFTIINIIGPGGGIVGVDTVYETIYREKALRNRYRTIDIPILAGYELPVNRWLFYAHGGALINLVFSQRGSMFLPQGEMPVDFGTLEQEGTPAFRNRLGIGWYAGAGIAYKIRHNLQITAEPHLRAFPRSITADAYPLKQQYLQGGLALGMRCQI